MPKFHLIKSGVVENTVLWDATPPGGAYPGFTVIDGSTGGPGWTWNGTTLSPPASPVLPVPAEISRLQLASGLYELGAITATEAEDMAAGPGIPAAIAAIIASLPIEQQVPTRIRFKGMTRAERTNPLVAAVAVVFGKTSAEMDDLWRGWSTL